MTDKEVGELWLRTYDCPCWECTDRVVPLIRKLVEERRGFYIVHESEWGRGTSLEAALRDFGIDPADFT